MTVPFGPLGPFAGRADAWWPMGVVMEVPHEEQGAVVRTFRKYHEADH